MARQFTRQAFYELVWSKPIIHVAKDFSLSDVAVHKICRKHDIPTPPLGWWAKQQAGKPVRQTALPKAAPGMSDRIVIAAPELRSEVDEVAKVREEARIRVSAPIADGEIKPHPIVLATLAALRRASPSAKGLIEVSGPGLIQSGVGRDSLKRLELILCRIMAAASAQGFDLETNARGAHFSGDGETIGFTVTETVQRVKHVLTQSEQRELNAWEKKIERRNRSTSWDYEFELRPHFDEWDYVCTGQLGFEMESVRVLDRQGPRSTFRDAKIQRLDDMSEDISVALAVLAVSKRQERTRRAEAERVRLEEKRIKEMPLREKYISERRLEGLETVLADLAGLDRLRRLLVGLETLGPSGDTPRVREFAAWASRELAAREAALSSDGLEQLFAEQRLFGDDDDHSFKSPHWF